MRRTITGLAVAGLTAFALLATLGACRDRADPAIAPTTRALDAPAPVAGPAGGQEAQIAAEQETSPRQIRADAPSERARRPAPPDTRDAAPATARTDVAIARDIRARLLADPVLRDSATVQVDVAAGLATLTGRVETLAQAQAAEAAARRAGASFVYNEIDIGQGPAPGAAGGGAARAPPGRGADRPVTDAELEARIETALVAEPGGDLRDLEVEVVDGVARVAGTVQSRLVRWRVISTVYALGAQRVISELDVIPLELDPEGRELGP